MEEAQLFTRWSLLVEIHSLFVTRCKITRYSLQNLLVVEIARCKKITHYSLQNSLVTRCTSCLLQNVTRYSLQSRLLLVVEVYRCKISFVTRCKICSLLVAEVAHCNSLLVVKFARCSLQKITRWSLQKCACYLLQNSFVTCPRSCLFQKKQWFLVAKFPQYLLQKIILR